MEYKTCAGAATPDAQRNSLLKDTSFMEESQMREELLKEMLEKASKEKPVTRQAICDTFYIGDRKARRMIEELREQGVRVCGLNTTEGYWIAKSQDEYEQFRRDYAAKAATIFRRVRNMDHQSEEGQVNFLELL